MTIRKTLLFSLMAIAFIAISINTIFLNSMVDKYFMKYLSESYDNHIAELKPYVQNEFTNSENFDLNGFQAELETYLDDPIVGIKIFDSYKNQILYVSKSNMSRHMMMGSRLEQTDRYIIKADDVEVAEMHIILNSSIEESLVAKKFQSSLIKYGAMGFALAGVLALAVGLYLSKLMSKDLIETSNMAESIDLNRPINNKNSNIKEIRVVQNSLRNLNQSLHLKQRHRKQLTDELRHKAQTPITIIQTHLEGIEDEIIDWDEKELKVFQKNIFDLSNLLNDVDRLIETDIDVDDNTISEFDVVSIINEISQSLSLQYQKKSMVIKKKLPRTLMVELDEYKFRQILYNLFTNAYKYAGEGSNVEIHLEESNSDFKIVFTDNGEGLDNYEVQNILEPYYRGVKHRNISGQGLGLYILEQNIKSMGGSVIIRQNTPSGLAFDIRLPKSIEILI